MLAACSITGLGTMSPNFVEAIKKTGYTGRGLNGYFYSHAAAMKEDRRLESGDLTCTAGFHHAGDGGDATYLVVSDNTLAPDESGCLPLDNGLFATLINVKAINYRMFGAVGDGKSDDGKQIKAAHAYANKHNIPVINLDGEYWIGATKNIVIQTNVDWGTTTFHIDEKYNNRDPLFHIESKHPPVRVELAQSQKQAFLNQFKPGVSILPMLEPYKNCLLVISDNKDRIGFRAGKAYANKVSRMREELFVVEEHGRIIGDIAWQFTNYTSFTAYRLDEQYLIIEGGMFYVSGDYSGDRKTGYVKNGFQITRSRTIIRNQWIGLENGKRDIALVARSGFYSFVTVYDCLLENVRLTPWEKDRGIEQLNVAQGTYGLSGNRMFDVVFRNVTAEGSLVHWGVFGTNMNKNFRVERCRLNRIDVHFHCWNLTVKDSEIGFKGISITGGGSLVVENTTCRHNKFINFRYDYGGKWDGSIYIKNCRLIPHQAINVAILSFLSANFDYHYPIGYAHKIVVEDFVVDYADLSDKDVPCWLMETAKYQPPSHRSLFFPVLTEFKNISVEGEGKGVRLLTLPNIDGYTSRKKGYYDEIDLVSNAQLRFENVQLEALAPSKERENVHIAISPPKHEKGASRLIPHITFKNCHNLRGYFGGNVLSLVFEDCTINSLVGADSHQLQGSLDFSNCKLKPILETAVDKPFKLDATLGTTFTNCLLLAPRINGEMRPDLSDNVGFVQINRVVKYNHLNTRLGNDILNYCKNAQILLLPAFISMLKSHHELEGEKNSL